MAVEQVELTEHSITVSAPPEVAYGVIANVASWPYFFPPTVYAERVEGDDSEERIRIWAFANGEVRNWTSRRWLSPESGEITFRQEVSQPPVASMGGAWSMRPGPDGGTLIVLKHDFTPVDDDPGKVEWIRQAVDRNSGSELAAVKAIAERHAELDDLVLTFSDSVHVDGDAPAVYDFIYRCQEWPQRLPQVARLVLAEEVPGIQVMEMDTRSPAGDVHTTKSVRVCFPSTRIVYKQIALPPIMAAHTGQWTFTPEAGGLRATSWHTVVIKPEMVAELLGPDGTVAEARRRIRYALGTNSRTTLERAKAHVEGGT